MKRLNIFYSFILLLGVLLCFSANLWARELSIINPDKPLAQEQPSLPAGHIDPYYSMHADYAKYLHGEDWGKHYVEIAEAFQKNMASNKPETIHTVLGFNNFLSFVKNADKRMGLHYAALNGLLKDAQWHDELMRQASAAKQGQEFYNQWNQLNYDVSQMVQILSNAREPLLKAIAIYKVPVSEINSSDATFKKISEDFYQGVFDAVKKLAKQVPAYDPLNTEDSQILYGYGFYSLIKNSSFAINPVIIGPQILQNPSQEKPIETPDDQANIGFVSFVKFGQFAFNKWGTYGGDGALDSSAFELLDLE